MASSHSVEASNDLISNLPELVIDKIFKRLTLREAAKTSILSRTWRPNWLSCKYLRFDHTFWKEFLYDWQKGSSVINNVLFHHNERLRSILFELRPFGLLVEKNASLSQWLSLFSRTCPEKINLLNWAIEGSGLVSMPSYIFHCKGLTKLKIDCFVLYAPPFGFKGFPYLRTLELLCVEIKHGVDMLWSLVAKCPCLISLRIHHCTDIDVLDADAPRLEELIIEGEFDSLTLKNCPLLVNVSLRSTKSQLDEFKQ